MLYFVTQSYWRIWKRPCSWFYLVLLFLGHTCPLRSFSTVLLCCLLVLSVALETTEARFTPSFSLGKIFWFVFLNISSVTCSDFLFQGTSYSVSWPLPSISIIFLLSVWGDVFLFFPASTEIMTDLYSVPYSTFSHVHSVLYCSNWSISSLLVSLDSQSVSLALQSFHLILFFFF